LGTVRRGILLLVALLVSWLSLSPAGAAVERAEPSGGLPRLMLWAWERPTDLRSLAPDVGVAFLAQTLIVRNDAVETTPRRNPLLVSPHTPLVAVTRIESHAPRLRSGQGAAESLQTMVKTMATAIAATASLARVRGVQIDFDAADSEREFYRALVVAVRQAVGPEVPLSITALASWCAQDRWMAGLPVDEAVPMLFRMGPLHAPYVGLARSPSAAAAECRGALGTSLDEPLHLRAAGRRVYVFTASPWTAASLTQAREVLE
jgi:hypothetical protein